MKKIITFCISVSFFYSSFAQYNGPGNIPEFGTVKDYGSAGILIFN